MLTFITKIGMENLVVWNLQLTELKDGSLTGCSSDSFKRFPFEREDSPCSDCDGLFQSVVVVILRSTRAFEAAPGVA